MPNQDQASEALPSNTPGNGSQSPPRREEPGNQGPPNQAAPCKATGPRSTQGKKRARFNALKHGLLSKDFLLEGESPDEYLSLSNGLHDYFQPESKFESALVENLTILTWRLRRFIKAENTEISKKTLFIEAEMKLKQADQALLVSRDAMVSDGLVAHDDNVLVIRDILDTWQKLSQVITAGEVSHSIPFINRLYGANQNAKSPDPIRQAIEKYVEVVKSNATQVEQSNLTEMKQMTIEIIDGEIKRFSKLKELREYLDHEKILLKEPAPGIPSREALDHLLRYEVHVNREIDRTLNRLERLQRIRKGQPLPPQLDVKIS